MNRLYSVLSGKKEFERDDGHLSNAAIVYRDYLAALVVVLYQEIQRSIDETAIAHAMNDEFMNRYFKIFFLRERIQQ